MDNKLDLFDLASLCQRALLANPNHTTKSFHPKDLEAFQEFSTLAGEVLTDDKAFYALTALEGLRHAVAMQEVFDMMEGQELKIFERGILKP